jgi:flagellar basal-body rod protein FlgC
MKTIGSAERITRGNIYRSLNIAGSGLTAQRQRMDAISSNIANISTTNVDGQGNPYLRRHVVMRPDPKQTFQTALYEATVTMQRTRPDHNTPEQTFMRMEQTPLVEGNEVEIPNMRKNVIYNPSHPDADANGFVVMPDINIIEELTDLMIASRAFDANVTVINAAKSMITKSLEI